MDHVLAFWSEFKSWESLQYLLNALPPLWLLQELLFSICVIPFQKDKVKKTRDLNSIP